MMRFARWSGPVALGCAMVAGCSEPAVVNQSDATVDAEPGTNFAAAASDASNGADADMAQDAAAAAPGKWLLSEGMPQKIGIQVDPESMTFDPLFLSCEEGPGKVMLAIVALPQNVAGKTVASFEVDGREFDLPGDAESMEGQDPTLTIDLPPSHPLLGALANARSLSLTISGERFALPVAGLAAAWPAFKAACRVG